MEWLQTWILKTMIILNNCADEGKNLADIPAWLSFSQGRRLSESIGSFTFIASRQKFTGEILLNVIDTNW